LADVLEDPHLMAQAPAPAQPTGGRIRLGEMLMREGLVTGDQLNRALDEQKALGGRLGRHLVDLGYITDAALLDSLSRQLRIPRVDLEAPGVLAPDASRYARADLAEQWGFCPLSFDPKRNTLLIAVSDPEPQLLADIESFLAMKVEPRLAPAEVIERVQRRLFHGDGSPVKRMAGLQVARAESRGPGPNDGLSLNAVPPPQAPAPAPVAPPPAPPVSPPVNPFEAQLAQQVAMQQQLHQQLQQQLQMQQMQQMQLQAQQAAQQVAVQQAAAQQAAANQFPPGMGQMPPGMLPGGMPPPGLGGPRPNGIPSPPVGAFPPGFNGVPPGQAYQGYPPTPNGVPTVTQVRPPSPAAPMVASLPMAPGAPQNGPSLESLQAQLDRLEKTLAAQARALRSLVEVLVDKGVLTKNEMARKQQTMK
jgi:hypothetical protein